WRVRRWSDTAIPLGAALVGYGMLITWAGVVVWRHYLIVTFPLEWLSLAYLALRHLRRPRLALGAVWVVQLCLSLTFLEYIHENGGAPGGDYGPAYSHQPHGPWQIQAPRAMPDEETAPPVAPTPDPPAGE